MAKKQLRYEDLSIGDIFFIDGGMTKMSGTATSLMVKLYYTGDEGRIVREAEVVRVLRVEDYLETKQEGSVRGDPA